MKYKIMLLLCLLYLSPIILAENLNIKTNEDNYIDTPIVLQNRFFIKSWRPEISLFGGTIVNETYSSTFVGGLRLGVFPSEFFGLEYAFNYYDSNNSPDLNALDKIEYISTGNKVKVHPAFSKLLSSHSLTLSIIPIYGKISLAEYYIIYSDIYFVTGLSLIKVKNMQTLSTQSEYNEVQQNKIAGILGIGQRFFFAKSFSLRIDISDYIYAEDRVKDTETTKATRHAWIFTLGFSAFVWSYD